MLVKKIKDYISIQNDTQSTLPVKTVVTKLAKLTENEDDSSYDSKLVGKVNSKAVLMGTTYHALLEKADFSYLDEDKEWVRLNKVLPNLTEQVNKKTFFLALNKIIALVGKRKFYREKPFVCKLNGGEVRSLSNDDNAFHDEGRVLVQGVIDLIIEDEDGYCLVDYKSGKIDESLLPSYKKQLALYALATEKILKRPVKQKLIFSINKLSFLEV